MTRYNLSFIIQDVRTEKDRKTIRKGSRKGERYNTMTYYRIDVITENEIITVCTTNSKEEAERQYDVRSETHSVGLFEMNI